MNALRKRKTGIIRIFPVTSGDFRREASDDLQRLECPSGCDLGFEKLHLGSTSVGLIRIWVFYFIPKIFQKLYKTPFLSKTVISKILEAKG